MPGPSEAQVAARAAYQHRLGMLLQEADDLPAALAALRAAFDALPADAKLLADLARVLIRQSRITEALALYERMEKAYPEHHARYEADLAAAIAESELTPGRLGVPVPRSTTSPKMIGEPDGATGAGADLLAGLEARLRSEPANRALRRELSVAYLRAGRVAEAKEQARLAEQLLGQRSAGEAKQPAG
jgi:tetratricopeptide (TPR) repeat protein